MNNNLEVIELTYKDIFNNFNISFPKNKFTVISGPNNCGKTTLIRIIGGEITVKDSILLYGARLEDIKITEISTIIKTIIPTEITFTEDTIEKELNYQPDYKMEKEKHNNLIKDLSKNFKLTKISTKSVENLSEKEIIRLQIALSLINPPKILVIDDFSYYFTKEESIELTNTIKDICQERKITLIIATNNMELALLSDYLYIISNSKIVLEGNPNEVMEKDNILNKHGIELPFMMDLSVKLKDYDLIDEIELDMNRLVDKLWK